MWLAQLGPERVKSMPSINVSIRYPQIGRPDNDPLTFTRKVSITSRSASVCEKVSKLMFRTHKQVNVDR